MTLKISQLIADLNIILQSDGDIDVVVRLPTLSLVGVVGVGDVKYDDPVDFVILHVEDEED